MTFSFEDQQARIANINAAERENRKYFRRVRIRDYIPGQVTYSLGEYPSPLSAAPTDYDRALLESMAKAGVGLVQLHEEWNDVLRMYGGDKFNAGDRPGMRAFVDYCHSLGMKVISYVSSGYFQETDPDFREEFCRIKKYCTSNYFKYRKASHGNALWREYILPKTFGVMDEYGFDGIFNDWGYDGTHLGSDGKMISYDPELEDMLGIIYHGIKQRGGVYKIHADRNNVPPCKDKVYDYLWIGEWVEDSPLGVGKDYPLYVVPCLDRHRDASLTQKDHFARTIPFLQFPLLKHGRPLRGKNVDLEGVTYYGGDEYNFFKEVDAYMSAHPEGPYVYSLWSSIPDDPGEYALWCDYLALYRPMVAENSLAYIQLEDSEMILSPLSENVVASMFVNEKTYLVLSNLSDAPYTLDLKDPWTDRVTGKASSSFVVPAGEMIFLEKNLA